MENMEPEELSTILMRIIRTLSESDSGQQREEQKRRLQHQFRDSDATINKLVQRKQKDLSRVMQMYARVSSRLSTARAKVRAIKVSLTACKELLHYKRDELKKHWLDGVQQKQVLELIEGIQTLKKAPDHLDSYLGDQNYLGATNLLVDSLARLNGDLRDVGGLSEIRAAVLKRKDKLYSLLMEKLSWLLYHDLDEAVDSSGLVGQGSNRLRSSGGRGGQKSKRETNKANAANKAALEAKEKTIFLDDKDLEAFLDLPVAEKISRETRPFRIVVAVQCLHRLQKLPDAIESLRGGQFNELQNIIQRTTISLRDSSKTYSGNLLSTLFSSVVDQLMLVAQGCHLISRTMVKVASMNSVWCQAQLDQTEVWEKVQIAIQAMLTDYLDFDNKTAIHQPSSAQFTEPTADINSYFVRRRNVRPKKTSLFRFNASSTGMTLHELENPKSMSDTNTELICSPNPHNVTLIYSCLMDFIATIEKALSYEPGKHCTLYEFLMNYIKDVFLGQINTDNSDTLHEAWKLLDSWKAETDMEVLRDYKATKPLLESAILVKKAIEELYRYMHDLPLYRERFLTMICTSVMKYKEICLAAYCGLVQPDSEDKRIISAQWAREEELGGALKELPNWIELRVKREKRDKVDFSSDHRNGKETAILKSKIGTHNIPSHEILSDASQFRSIGLLQESMEWFSKGVISVEQKLHRSNEIGLGGMPKLSTNSIKTLLSLAKEFEGISDTCLLILHLEVRLHCFYYLYPVRFGAAGAHFCGGPDSTDPNQEVLRLNSDLLDTAEVLSTSIQEEKVIYVFEGVSHLIASIFIDSIVNIRKINKHGVKKMCRNVFSIQHTLTSNITGSRENSLDQAKQYYEILNLRAQDVWKEIYEKGPMFSHDQYMKVLELLHRSDPNSSAELHRKHAAKLTEIIKRIGVAV